MCAEFTYMSVHLLFYVCWVYMYDCIPHACLILKKAEDVIRSLGTGIQAVMSSHVDAENQT